MDTKSHKHKHQHFNERHVMQLKNTKTATKWTSFKECFLKSPTVNFESLKPIFWPESRSRQTPNFTLDIFNTDVLWADINQHRIDYLLSPCDRFDPLTPV